MTMANKLATRRELLDRWRGIERVRVNSERVRRTVSRCPSDLIALSFFLWSAQRCRHDSLDLDCVVPVLRRLTDRYNTVPAMLSELESIGGSLTNPKSQLVLLRVYRRAGMYDMVAEAYKHMKGAYGFVPDTFARNLMMDVLFRTGHSHVAVTLSLFNHTHPPNFFTFNIALLHLSNLNLKRDGHSHNHNTLPYVSPILRLMLRAGYSPSPLAFRTLLNSFCNINALPQAYQLLALMTVLGISFSVNIWTILIHTYCKLGLLNLATNLFNNMLQTGCSPNVVTYTILFKAFMQSNMQPRAFGLFNVMLSAGQIPDLILSNVLIDCLSKAGRCHAALRVFLTLSEQNLKPDSYTFTSLLSTICRSRMFYLLPKLVLVSRHIDTDLVFCNALLSSLTKAELPSLAVAFYDRMIDKGFVPDRYSFAGLLSALCAAGRVDEAVNVYLAVVTSYRDNDAHLHTLITGELIRVRKYHKAASVTRLAVMNRYPLDSVAYTVGLCALLRDGRIQEACSLYDRMKDNGLKPSVHTYNMMFFIFCKERDFQAMKQILHEMIDSRVQLSDRNFFNFCKYACRSDICLSALKLLAEMRDLRLLSAKALHALHFDRHDEGIQENINIRQKPIQNGTQFSIHPLCLLYDCVELELPLGIGIFVGFLGGENGWLPRSFVDNGITLKCLLSSNSSDNLQCKDWDRTPFHGQHQMQFSQPLGHQPYQGRQLSSGHVQHDIGQSQHNQGNQVTRLSRFSGPANSALFIELELPLGIGIFVGFLGGENGLLPRSFVDNEITLNSMVQILWPGKATESSTSSKIEHLLEIVDSKQGCRIKQEEGDWCNCEVVPRCQATGRKIVCAKERLQKSVVLYMDSTSSIYYLEISWNEIVRKG
ncbi:unnamed protein product [Sphenostylis stenocarpa]|uniref:Pentatricopeptide repeat-containing protein n=1 Tax=Sphenostylis stenocarpa TaxID=92480 RepID=A0AA86VKT1_9FABA|nr:unnamed protein product [Sphenostylis stenocarpa]